MCDNVPIYAIIHLFVCFVCNMQQQSKTKKMVLLNSGKLYMSFFKETQLSSKNFEKFLDIKTRKFPFWKIFGTNMKIMTCYPEDFLGLPICWRTLLSLKWLFS